MSKNIHKLDKTSFTTLKDMLFSTDEGSSKMALEMLRNVDTKDGETMKHVSSLVEGSIVDLYNANSELMKEVVDVVVGYLKKGKVTLPEPTFDPNKEAKKDLSLLETAVIEQKFNIRKKLAKEWLKDKTTDERKKEIEDEINVLNRYVACIMNIEYEDRV